MDPKLAQAVQAIKSGDKAGGMVLLAQVLRSDPNNESAWIWMATAQDDPEKKKLSLERVLRINPGNETVRRALSVLYPEPAAPVTLPAAAETIPEAKIEEKPVETPIETAIPITQGEPEIEDSPPSIEFPPVGEPDIVNPAVSPEAVQSTAVQEQPQTQAAAAMPATIETAETPPIEPAAPDLSWLTETAMEPEKAKEEAPDLSWLKEDLPDEIPSTTGTEGFEAARPEPSEPEWLKETFPPTDTGDLSGAPASGGTDDLSWLRGISTTAEHESEGAPGETPPSWLPESLGVDDKSVAAPFDETALPWLNGSTASTEGPAVKNDTEAMPEWLRQAPDEPSISQAPEQQEETPAPERIQAQENPTLETEPLSLSDLDAITARKAELPFTWDEVTGEPVMKIAEEDQAGDAGAGVVEESLKPVEAMPEPSPATADEPTPDEVTPAAAIPPISRPRPDTKQAPVAQVRSAQKKGMTTGQVVLLVGLGVVTVLILLAFAFYLAVNFGLLKTFGF